MSSNVGKNLTAENPQSRFAKKVAPNGPLEQLDTVYSNFGQAPNQNQTRFNNTIAEVSGEHHVSPNIGKKNSMAEDFGKNKN